MVVDEASKLPFVLPSMARLASPPPSVLDCVALPFGATFSLLSKIWTSDNERTRCVPGNSMRMKRARGGSVFGERTAS